MIDAVKSIKGTVYACLRDEPRCRDDDMFLLFTVWHKWTNLNIFLTVRDRFLKQVPHFESIRRSRQLYQSQGKFPACKEVRADRKLQEKDMRLNIHQEDGK